MYLVHFILADRTSCAVHAMHADCAFLLCASQFDLSKVLNRSGRSVHDIEFTQLAQPAQFVVLVSVRGLAVVLSSVKWVHAVLVDRKLRSPHS